MALAGNSSLLLPTSMIRAILDDSLLQGKNYFFLSNKINTLTPPRDQENCSVIEWLSYRGIRLFCPKILFFF